MLIGISIRSCQIIISLIIESPTSNKCDPNQYDPRNENLIKETNFLDLNCRHCRFYQPEGRRGGSCQKLGVSVLSNWKACTLACSPFTSTLKNLDTNFIDLEKTLINLEEIVHLETSLSLPCKNQDGIDTQEPSECVDGIEPAPSPKRKLL